jgi:predicted ATPase
VCGRGQGALSLWLLGYPDQAKDSVRAAVDLAVDLGHAPSLAHALFWSALCHQFRQEGAPALACSQRLIELAGEQGLRLYAAGGMIIRGWALAAEGKVRQGLAELRSGLKAYTVIEAKLLSSFFKAALAESLHRVGKTKAALLAIDEAFSRADQTAEHFWQAAMLRLKGDMFLAADPPDHAHAEASLRAALDVARKQQARSLELRAATSLARLWRDQGRPAEAHDLIAPVYGWFTEGFDTLALIDAKALLDDLG